MRSFDGPGGLLSDFKHLWPRRARQCSPTKLSKIIRLLFRIRKKE